MSETVKQDTGIDDEKDEPIKHVKDNLESRGLIFVSQQIDDDTLLQNTKDNSSQFSAFFYKLYEKFTQKLLEKSTERFDGKTYPQYRRFGVFIDRDTGSAKDEITFFEVCYVIN